MAVFLFLLGSLGVVLVGDLVLENPAAGEVTVFNQPIGGYSEGVLLAMAAALGFVVAVLLVASMSSTRARRARRKQLRTVSSGMQRQGAAPEREQASLLDEWFGRHVTLGDLGEPAQSTTWGDRTDDRRSATRTGPAEHYPGSFRQRTRRAAPWRNDPGLGLPPDHEHAP
jgi:hypothetical protein